MQIKDNLRTQELIAMSHLDSYLPDRLPKKDDPKSGIGQCVPLLGNASDRPQTLLQEQERCGQSDGMTPFWEFDPTIRDVERELVDGNPRIHDPGLTKVNTITP